MLAGVWLFGVEISVTVMTFAYLKLGCESWTMTLMLTLVAWLFVRLTFIEFMHLPFPDGIIVEWFQNS